MKLFLFLFLILIFLTGNINPQELKHYNRYAKRLYEENTDWKIQIQKLEKIQAIIEQKQRLLRNPVNVDISISRGTYAQPASVFREEPSYRKSISEYTIGISKAIDLQNIQRNEREIALLQKEQEEYLKKILKFQLKHQFEFAYVSILAYTDLLQHIQKHIQGFENLRRIFYNFHDRKLGTYTQNAIDVSIETLKSEYHTLQSFLRKETDILKILLNEETLLFDDFEEFAGVLSSIQVPGSIPGEFKNSPLYGLEMTGLLIEEKKLMLAKKQKWGEPEAFLSYTEKTTGNYGNTFDTFTPQKENFWSLGMKFPLPIGSETMDLEKIQEKEISVKKLNIEKLERKLRMELETSYLTFLETKEQFLRNLRILKKQEIILTSLEQALRSRRITFFEYWNEHEKFHNLYQLTMELMQKTIESLHTMELYANRILFPAGEKL